MSKEALNTLLIQFSFSNSVSNNSVILHSAIIHTARKISKYRVFSGPYFPVFGLNTGKDGPEKTPYLDTFYTMSVIPKIKLIAKL